MKRGKKRKTIYLIAKEAGVSVTTISRFLNGQLNVKKETEKKINEVCSKHNYTPSYVARAITTKRTKTIALMVSFLRENTKTINLISSIEGRLYDYGYCLNLFNSNLDDSKQLEIIKTIDDRIIDGVIVVGSAHGGIEDEIVCRELAARKIPMIFVLGVMEHINAAYVTTDDRKGGKKVANYLIENNHKNFGIVTWGSDIRGHVSREMGFLEGLKENKIDVRFILRLPNINSTHSSINNFFKDNFDTIIKSKVSAIFCTADIIALYFMEFLNLNNYKIPEDISIVGFSDIELSELVFPKLTTVNHDCNKIGVLTVDNLIKKIEKGRYIKKKTILEPELIIRDSVSRIKKNRGGKNYFN